MGKNVGVLIALVIFLHGCGLVTDDVVATVNGEPIYSNEFSHFIVRHRALFLQEFRAKHQIDDSANCWQLSYDGVTPSDLIKEKVLNELVRIKIQQILAWQHGIVENVRFNDLLKELEIVNKKRRQAATNGNVIYGPVEYSVATYWDYNFGEMVRKLKAKLAPQLVQSERSVFSFYTNQAALFLTPNGELLPYGHNKNMIRLKLLELRYQEMIDGYMKRAVVKINAKALKRLEVE